MIVLSAADITKEYGTDVILKNVSFHINKGDRVGLIGANGAGKTTLMRILSGEISATSGNSFVSAGTVIGYLRQKDDFQSERTVFEEVDNIFSHLHKMEENMRELSEQIAGGSERGEDVTAQLHRYDEMRLDFEGRGGYSYKSEINGILASMAFTPDFYDKKISSLSGGERTRLALACLLLKKPDILFLDEPTNHLDIGTLKWLEQYLKGYNGTILLISHDRYFLDKITNRIFEIENNKLFVYEGNYSAFAEKKAQRRAAELSRYEKQQTEIARQEEIIRRFKQHGTEHLTKRALSREKMLEHMELVDKPENLPSKMKMSFRQNFQSGNDVLLGEGLAKGFGFGARRKELFENVSFDIKKGERICIVGPNGVGKTTLLKIMMEQLSPDRGRIKKGHNVAFGYYDQGQMLLSSHNTVLEEMKESYRLYSDTEMRSILGRFLFFGDDVFLKVEALSGGEKAKLSLLKLMLSGANTLILDEPTNHLDIGSKEIFEEALLSFPGTVIVVSHDRYFLNRIPTRIFELTRDGIDAYLGAYDYYVEKKQSIESGKKYLKELSGAEERSASILPGTEGELSAAEERRLKKEQEREERRLARIRENLEQEIELLEKEIKELTAQMCMEENIANHQLLEELHSQIEIKEQLLTNKYNKWEELS